MLRPRTAVARKHPSTVLPPMSLNRNAFDSSVLDGSLGHGDNPNSLRRPTSSSRFDRRSMLSKSAGSQPTPSTLYGLANQDKRQECYAEYCKASIPFHTKDCYPQAQSGDEDDDTMPNGSDIQDIDDHIPTKGSHTNRSHWQQNDQDMIEDAWFDLSTQHSSPRTCDPSQIFSQCPIDHGDDTDGMANDLDDSDVDDVPTPTCKEGPVTEEADDASVDDNASDIVECASDTTESITNADQPDFPSGSSDNGLAYDHYAQEMEVMQDWSSQFINLPIDNNMLDARSLDVGTGARGMDWVFPPCEARQELSPAAIAQLLEQDVLQIPSQPRYAEHHGVEPTSGPQWPENMSSLPPHFQADEVNPADSIDSLWQNVDNLLAQRDITTLPTHMLASSSRPEGTFSGIGYPADFRPFMQNGLPYTPQHRHFHPDPYAQPSTASIASAAPSMHTHASIVSGVSCSVILESGEECGAFYKGKHAKSHLGRHVRSKHDNKIFPCDACEKVYTRRNYRSEHYAKCHRAAIGQPLSTQST